ncbi:MAG: hypothetical protein ACFHWZ_01145 [Phycisphaerales bacterium]
MLLVRIHRKPFRPILKVPTIGELTAVSHVLIGMALAARGITSWSTRWGCRSSAARSGSPS